MRILAVILYIVVFALNVIPDDHHSHGGTEAALSNEFSDDLDSTHEHNTHDHNNENGLCSPFCIDDCCSTPVVTSAPIYISSIIYEDHITENDIIVNYQYSSVDTSTPPPRIV